MAMLVTVSLVAGACGQRPSSLVVLTHPDDELTMVDYLLIRGAGARLLFLTRGETTEVPAGRVSEAETAQRFYGSAAVELYTAPAGAFALDPTNAWHRWDVEGAIAAVVRAIDRQRPEEVVTWMPNIAAVHGEHQLTGILTIAACLRARHPPRRLLFTYEARKVGYYRMRPVVFDPHQLGMPTQQFVAPYPLDHKRLAHLYPSMPVGRWLAQAGGAYRAGSRLVCYSTPQPVTLPPSPPVPSAPLPGFHRVLPHFSGWLTEVGLAPMGRVIALIPPQGAASSVASDSEFTFARHTLSSVVRDGILYVLLPQDVQRSRVFGL